MAKWNFYRTFKIITLATNPLITRVIAKLTLKESAQMHLDKVEVIGSNPIRPIAVNLLIQIG
jgi:hypothetical protein